MAQPPRPDGDGSMPGTSRRAGVGPETPTRRTCPAGRESRRYLRRHGPAPQEVQPEPPGRRRRSSRRSSRQPRRPGPPRPGDRSGHRHPDRRPAARRCERDGRGARPPAGRPPARPLRRGAGAAARRGRRPGRRGRGPHRPPWDLVANLPYHITSPVLHHVLGPEPRPGALRADAPARGGRAHQRRRRAA